MKELYEIDDINLYITDYYENAISLISEENHISLEIAEDMLNHYYDPI